MLSHASASLPHKAFSRVSAVPILCSSVTEVPAVDKPFRWGNGLKEIEIAHAVRGIFVLALICRYSAAFPFTKVGRAPPSFFRSQSGEVRRRGTAFHATSRAGHLICLSRWRAGDAFKGRSTDLLSCVGALYAGDPGAFCKARRRYAQAPKCAYLSRTSGLTLPFGPDGRTATFSTVQSKVLCEASPT